MEVQRCIWRCLANAAGADDPAYHRCVQRNCNDGEPPADAAPAVSASRGPVAWKRAEHVDYLAFSACESENMCLFVSCPAPGMVSLELLAFEHGTATGEPIELRVDGRSTTLSMPPEEPNGLYRWPLTPALTAALRAGAQAEVAMDAGGPGSPISLRGSQRAIDSLLASCRG